MTLGERILKYRKKAGISQEELADRLNVTRQSISLWETDQTLPSLDNLIALAQIFNISMDELCGMDGKEAQTPQEKTADGEDTAGEQQATGIHTDENQKCLANANATLTPALLKNMRSQWQRKHIISYVISMFCCVLLIVSSFLSEKNYDKSVGAIFILLLIADIVLLIRTLVAGDNQYKKNLQKYQHFTYKYLFYDDHFMVKTISDTSESVFSVKYGEIRKTVRDKDFVFVYYENSILPIQISSISDCVNIILGLLSPNPTSARQNKLAATANLRESTRIMLIIMFVFSLLSVFIALMLVMISTKLSQGPESIDTMIEYMWEFFLVIPIPLTSAILGIVYLKKQYKCKKNIIAGFIMTAILALYGCFTFMF